MDTARRQVIDDLTVQWRQALDGFSAAQALWRIAEGGVCEWSGDGLRLHGADAEWAGVAWQRCGPDALGTLRNFMIEVTVSGKAGAAGLSFGPYKDFLIQLEPEVAPRRLQLEIDLDADRWLFRVDGQLMARQWWNSGVHSAHDFTAGMLSLKARHLDHALFQNLTLHSFTSSCQLSVIMTCNRFLQRLRITLRNWCHQQIDCGMYEVLVVNPYSPDGAHEHLAAVARCYTDIRVREITVDTSLATNKGVMINQAIHASRGAWIWLTDADCLFGPQSAALVLAQVHDQRDRLFYGQRRYLTQAHTDALLAGRCDGLADFETLANAESQRGPDHMPWGYTQIVHRSVLERIPYRESINHYAHSDSIFIEECRRRRILPTPIEGLFCLHLDHPFAWYGTKLFL